MSSPAFMLPALPQIPASGFNRADTRGPAALTANPPGDLSDSNKSFSTTLNRISERRYDAKPKAIPAEKPKVTSRGPSTDSSSSQKLSKTSDRSHDQIREDPVALLNQSAAFFCQPSDSISESSGLMLTELIGHLYQQSQQAEGELLGIGPFEQLQISISPETTNQAFFNQFASNAFSHQNGEGLNNKTARLLEFMQWMLPSASTALDGTANSQPESSGINGNATLNPLLQMTGITGTAWGTNPDASSSQGPMTEGAHLNGALLDRLLTPFQPVQAEISEEGKIAAAGREGRLTIWATGDLNSEIPLEAHNRQMSENSQPLKIQAELKAAAEQPANPNSVNEGIAVKTQQEILGFKSAAQKNEMLSFYELGSKINRIDGDSKDSGFLFSQDQMPQHLTRLETAAASSEATQRSLMSQSLNQIVQKAVLSFHNGQNEVLLHLKPDLLGHIRMQIISEGQQVAIKMVAEFPFVKDMLENNLQQLKADLQSQGLDIDELEVSVAHDSHAERDVHQNSKTAKLQAMKTGTDSDDGAVDASGQTQSRDGRPMAETAIDFFA